MRFANFGSPEDLRTYLEERLKAGYNAEEFSSELFLFSGMAALGAAEVYVPEHVGRQTV